MSPLAVWPVGPAPIKDLIACVQDGHVREIERATASVLQRSHGTSVTSDIVQDAVAGAASKMVQSETVVDNLRSYWIVASVNVGRDIMKHHWHSKRQFVPVDGGVSQDTSRYAYPDLAERARARTLLENTANIADTPLGRLLRQEVADEVAAFVSRLDTSIREPLVLKDVEDLTHEEIALKIGISVGACKMRVMRARQLLRDWIDDERPDIMTTEFGG